jgi:ABC-type antimicrobial peptide transport system permease subunit
LINIGGLMIGLTTGVVILLYVMSMVDIDRTQKNLRDIGLLMINDNLNSEVNTSGHTPGNLASVIRGTVPLLKYVVRTSDPSSALVRVGDKALYQTGLYAEPDYFSMMTYPAVQGDPAAVLRGGSAVVLTQSAARAIFGSEDALGKTVMVNNIHPFKVGSVIQDLPASSSTHFDMVLPFQVYERDNASWMNRWNYNGVQTWVQLQPRADRALVDKQLTRVFLANQNDKQQAMFAYPLRRLQLYDSFKNGKPNGGKIFLVMTLAALAGFVLLIACVNFMNLATAMAARRAKEVGMRKVLGASRAKIVAQFLGEAVLLSMLALALSIALTYMVLPWFSALTGKDLSDELRRVSVWAVLIGLGVVTGLVAGSYPALFLSRFRPIGVLRRATSVGNRRSFFRRGLVTFQFVISISLLISVVVVYRQIQYVADRPIGYAPSNLIDVSADGDLGGHYDLFKTQLGQIPGIQSVSASTSDVVHDDGAFNGLSWPGKTPDQDFFINMLKVQYNWTATTGIQLAEGRDFSPSFGSDSSACIINESAVRRMHLKEPVLGTLLGDNRVIGVIKDYVYDDPAANPRPLIAYLGKGGLGHVLVRIANDDRWRTRIDQIQAVARKLNPGYPFTFHFAVDQYQDEFTKAYSLRQLMGIFGGMGIFIACLGLFGLSGFLVERRRKEIGIRKVLGARAAGLWLSLSSDFLRPVLLGFVLAAPLAGYLLQRLLDSMDYHIHLRWWMFALPGFAAMVVALATVSYHGIRGALANPARALHAD